MNEPTLFQIACLAAILYDRHPSTTGAIERAICLWKEADKQLAIEADFAASTLSPSPPIPIALTSDGRAVICLRCHTPMNNTADDSWHCPNCNDVWSVMKDPLPPS